MNAIGFIKREDARKTGKGYLFSRIYCLAIILIWNSLLYWEFRPGGTRSVYIFFMLPLVFPSLSMFASLIAFPWRYSAFGPYQWTRPPGEQALIVKRFAGIRIGWLQTPFTMTLYPSGLALSIFGVGKAFIPLESISHLEQGMLERYTLHHCWPEVRSPIKFGGQKIYTGLMQLHFLHNNPTSLPLREEEE